MAVHSFDLGETVTVFQMSPAKGLLIEGLATIVNLVDGVDEYYEVRFKSDLEDYVKVKDSPTYQRFLDREGSNCDDPRKYLREFNRKIGK